MKKEAMLYEKLEGRKVHCLLCAHSCVIGGSKYGLCGVRKNENGVLYTLVYGETIARHVDPIEKKPLYNFLPGTASYSIATIGCNFRCGFCQNWQISQASKRDGDIGNSCEVKPEEVVSEAKRTGCRSISYTYTEPTIFFEYAYDTARVAKQSGLRNNFVTNGFMTKQALDKIHPYLDAANVDLKSFSDEFYKKNCKARLAPVLDSIKRMKELNIWIEVTTLIIPGENDSDGELAEIAGFIAGVGNEIPWHISRFHPDYQFTEHIYTPPESLEKAREIGHKCGLRYVYLGNVPGGGDTFCYKCGAGLIKRSYMQSEEINIAGDKCASCGAEVDGVWS